MYKFYNANSHGNFINDCVVRAFSTVNDISWSKAYKILSDLARKKGLLLDDVNFVVPLLDELYKRLNIHDLITIGEFAEENPRGKYLITTRGHITSLKDGTVIDTWDCRDRLIENVWKV